MRTASKHMAHQLFAIVALALMIDTATAHAAKSCSAQYAVCFDLCTKYGFGRNRTDHPHPQPRDICRNHCVGWKSTCLQDGCWHGDLVQTCGLDRR